MNFPSFVGRNLLPTLAALSTPTISGTATVGVTLTSSTGTWLNMVGGTFAYQWQADGSDIAGATSTTLLLANAHEGKAISIRITASNTYGATSASSAATSAVTNAPHDMSTPVITGAASIGGVLTASVSSVGGYPAPTATYQWYSGGVAISGQTAISYTVLAGDYGNTITVQVTETNVLGSVNATSNAFGPITDAPLTGWNTLPLGAGGLIPGLHVANDGSIVCRSDVGGAFVWSGTMALASLTDPNQKWTQVMNFTSLGSGAAPYTGSYSWEYVQAPGNSNYQYLMMGDTAGTAYYYLYYSTNKGASFTKSNLKMTPNGDLTHTQECYKIAADPANEKIVYCGMVVGSGNSFGVYTTFDRTLGHTWPTFNGATLDGSTAFPLPTVGGTGAVAGMVFDTSLGTITINGQTVTKRILLCVGGSGIYETTDGGQNWSEIAASAFGTSSFHVYNAVLDGATNANLVKNLYVTVPETGKLWRYIGGGTSGWADITPSPLGNIGYTLICDPRSANVGHLSVTGIGHGMGAGYTTTNATGATPSWAGRTGGEYPYLQAASYDIPYLNYIFGQQSASAYAFGAAAWVDNNGTCIWAGNQSIWYFSDNTGTVSTLPDYGASIYTYSWSFGRGQETTVAEDVLCPAGATNPILACQDIGAPAIGNTFSAYPTDLAVRFKEYTCQNLEWAADDPSFIVARITGQVLASSFTDVSAYSTDIGATWTPIAGVPTNLWQSTFSGFIDDGSGGGSPSGVAGNILTVVSFSSGNLIIPQGLIYLGSTYEALVHAYGSGGTTGTGGVGTYQLDSSRNIGTSTFTHQVWVQGGQTVAADKDHWVTVPNSNNGAYFIPAYTTNARTTASWSLTNLPAWPWLVRPSWQYGPTSKPFAVGYGTDLGTVWAAQYKPNGASSSIVLWRSTDYGATYSNVGSVTTNQYGQGVYLLSVPGYPDELWLGLDCTAGGTGLWRITNARTGSPPTFTAIASPTSPSPARALLRTLTLGAPATTGGYPTLYATFEQTGAGTVPSWLYQGTWNGSSVTWSLYGPAGALQGSQEQLPVSMQINGFGHIKADWNVYGRIYAMNNGLGFAYYNP